MIRTIISSLLLVSAMSFAMAQDSGTAPEAGDAAEEAAESAVDENVWTAVDALEDIGADPQKLAGYCAIVKEIAAADGAGDEAKVEEAENKMQAYLEGLGEDHAYAWELGEDIDADSEGGKVLEEAFSDLEDLCGD